MGIIRSLAPVAEPLSLDEMKGHLRIDNCDEDALLDGFIVSAREMAEKFCERSFLTQQWRLALDHFPGLERHHNYCECEDRFVPFEHLRFRRGIDSIFLEQGPVQSVNSITYLDITGTQQTLDASCYIFDNNRECEARLAPAYAKYWPATALTLNTVFVNYTTGYGDTPDTVPFAIRQAMKLQVATWYQNREASIVGMSSSPLPPSGDVEAILWSHRIVSWR